MATNRSPWTVLRYIVMARFAVTSFYPFFWIVINSVKSNDEIMGKPFALPTALHLENYVTRRRGIRLPGNGILGTGRRRRRRTRVMSL